MQDNYFTLLGLEQGMEVDPATLSQNYLKLQTQFHPDKFIGKSDVEKAESMHKSSLINEAYKVLKDKFTRLEYLLQLAGKTEFEASQEVLMETMELREEYDAETIQEVKKEIEELIKAAGQDLGLNKIDDAANKYVRIKYLKKFIQDVTADS